MLLSRSECCVRVELVLQLEARLWEGDDGSNSLQSQDILLEFLPETGHWLIFLLLGDKQFAESGDDLDKRALIIVDPTAKLIERGQDPEDVELACGVAIHVCELLADRIIALTKEGRHEGDFVVLIIALMFAVLGILDLEDELCFIVCRIQRGLGKLVVGAGRKGGKSVFEISSTYGGGDANSFLDQFGISTGSELVRGDDNLPQHMVLALKKQTGPVRTRACARAGAGGSVGSTHVSGC